MDGMKGVRAIWAGIAIIAVLQLVCIALVLRPVAQPDVETVADYAEQFDNIEHAVDEISTKVKEIQAGTGEPIKLVCKNSLTYGYDGKSACTQVSTLPPMDAIGLGIAQ